MTDRSPYNKSNFPQISEDLQNFINELVKEVVFGQREFDITNKRWLRKYTEYEGIDYQTLELELQDFFTFLKDYNATKTDSYKRLLLKQAKNCYIYQNTLELILDSNQNRKNQAINQINTTINCHKLSENNNNKIGNTILAPVKKNGLWGFINRLGEFIIQNKYTKIGDFSESYVAVAMNDKWGYIDNLGNEIVEQSFSSAYPFHDGLAVVSDSQYRYGFVNIKGDIVIPIQYSNVSSFSKGIASTYMKTGVKMQFINRQGIEVLKNINYFFIAPYHDGRALVGKDKIFQGTKYGYINEKFEESIPFIYSNGTDFFNGYACVKKNDKWGIINCNGNIVIDFCFDQISVFTEERAYFKKRGLLGSEGWLNMKGDIVFKLKSNENPIYCNFHDGYVCVECNGKKGFYDRSGTLSIPFLFDTAENFKEGIAKVSTSKGYLFIDKLGQKISNKFYDKASSFQNDMAMVCYNGKCGYIDKTGNEVIPLIFEEAGDFKDVSKEIELYLNVENPTLVK